MISHSIDSDRTPLYHFVTGNLPALSPELNLSPPIDRRNRLRADVITLFDPITQRDFSWSKEKCNRLPDDRNGSSDYNMHPDMVLNSGRFFRLAARLLTKSWRERWDAKSGRVFYWNVRTGKTQWERPEDFWDSGVALDPLWSLTRVSAKGSSSDTEGEPKYYLVNRISGEVKVFNTNQPVPTEYDFWRLESAKWTRNSFLCQGEWLNRETGETSADTPTAVLEAQVVEAERALSHATNYGLSPPPNPATLGGSLGLCPQEVSLYRAVLEDELQKEDRVFSMGILSYHNQQTALRGGSNWSMKHESTGREKTWEENWDFFSRPHLFLPSVLGTATTTSPPPSSSIENHSPGAPLSPRHTFPEIHGLLWKRGGGSRFAGLLGSQSWKRRFVVVSSGVLSYFPDETAFLSGHAPLKNHGLELAHYTVKYEGGADGLEFSLTPKLSSFAYLSLTTTAAGVATAADDHHTLGKRCFAAAPDRAFYFRSDSRELCVAWVACLKGDPPPWESNHSGMPPHPPPAHHTRVTFESKLGDAGGEAATAGDCNLFEVGGLSLAAVGGLSHLVPALGSGGCGSGFFMNPARDLKKAEEEEEEEEERSRWRKVRAGVEMERQGEGGEIEGRREQGGREIQHSEQTGALQSTGDRVKDSPFQLLLGEDTLTLSSSNRSSGGPDSSGEMGGVGGSAVSAAAETIIGRELVSRAESKKDSAKAYPGPPPSPLKPPTTKCRASPLPK